MWGKSNLSDYATRWLKIKSVCALPALGFALFSVPPLIFGNTHILFLERCDVDFVLLKWYKMEAKNTKKMLFILPNMVILNWLVWLKCRSHLPRMIWVDGWWHVVIWLDLLQATSLSSCKTTATPWRKKIMVLSLVQKVLYVLSGGSSVFVQEAKIHPCKY